jgi:hypothetical protein
LHSLHSASFKTIKPAPSFLDTPRLHPLDRRRNVCHVSNSKHTTEKEFVDRMIPTDTTIKEGIELLGGRTMLFHVAFCTCNKLNRLTKSMGLYVVYSLHAVRPSRIRSRRF